MAAKTPKKLILDALKDLGKSELEEFCSALLDCRGEPRIYKCEIEDKSRIQITDQLLETFTEDRAMEVTLKIMKEINCNHVTEDLEQAVNLKNQLESDLKSLQNTRDKYKEFQQTYNTVIDHNRKKVVTTEEQIRAEIEKLHQFLRDEEKTRLEALREEEKEKAQTVNREMEDIQRKISSLRDNISAIEQELQKSIRHRVQCPVSEPQLLSGVRIDVSKHLGNLTYRVWEKMKEKVKFTPVILDPNTAHPRLCLSEDLTSVTLRTSHSMVVKLKQWFFPNSKRCASVLGSEGFSSGKHSWDVYVGRHPWWAIGLARESVGKKGNIYETPDHGVWCIGLKDGKYRYEGDGETIPVQRNHEWIRVQLDYDGGEVSFYNPFYNPAHNHIYTLKHTFTEKLFPYFSIGLPTSRYEAIRVGGVQTIVSVMLR